MGGLWMTLSGATGRDLMKTCRGRILDCFGGLLARKRSHKQTYRGRHHPLPDANRGLGIGEMRANYPQDFSLHRQYCISTLSEDQK